MAERRTATVLAAAGGVSYGLAAPALGAVADDLTPPRVAVLGAASGVAALCTALLLALCAALQQRGAEPRHVGVLVAGGALVSAAVTLATISGLSLGIACVAGVLAALIGYSAPSPRDRAGTHARVRALAESVRSAGDRLPEPWLIAVAEDAAEDDHAMGTAIALGRAATLLASSLVGLGAAAGVLLTMPGNTSAGEVVTAALTVVLLVTAATSGGFGWRAATGRPTSALRRRSPTARPIRPHSGTVSIHSATDGDSRVQVASGQHVGFLVHSAEAARQLACEVAGVAVEDAGRAIHFAADGRPCTRYEVLRQTGVVTPEVTLIDGSVRENLVLDKTLLDDARLNWIATTCNLVRTPQEGLDAPVDAAAATDASIAYRLSLARASAMAVPVVVIFDPYEIDDHPRPPSQTRAVLGVGRTVISISSRPAALADSDFVVDVMAEPQDFAGTYTAASVVRGDADVPPCSRPNGRSGDRGLGVRSAAAVAHQ